MTLDIVIAATTFLALLLLALAGLRGVSHPAEARIRALAVARRGGTDLSSVPFRERVILPLVESTGRRVTALLPGELVRQIERRLTLAGQPMPPATFWTLALGAGAVPAGAYALLILAASQGRPSAALLPTALFGALGALLPVYWLSSRARARKNRMLAALPDSLDLLTICLEAGLGLDGAFHQLAEKQSGPLVDELRRMLREIGLGKIRRQALLDLADRTGIDDVRTLVNAIVQAEQMGTSLAPVLRAQAQRLRVRRRQRAEQEARRAPVKMVFPLVFCLMPSLFIIILGPLIISLVDFLAGQ